MAVELCVFREPERSRPNPSSNRGSLGGQPVNCRANSSETLSGAMNEAALWLAQSESRDRDPRRHDGRSWRIARLTSREEPVVGGS